MAYFVRNKRTHQPVYKILTFIFLFCSKYVGFIEKVCFRMFTIRVYCTTNIVLDTATVYETSNEITQLSAILRWGDAENIPTDTMSTET